MRRRVLVVEDDRTLQRALVEGFTARGYEAVSASSFREADERMAKATFDVVIADWDLLGPSGIRVLHLASVKLPSAVRILITGTDQVPPLVGSPNGIDAFFRKPVTIEEIDRFLATWSAPSTLPSNGLPR